MDYTTLQALKSFAGNVSSFGDDRLLQAMITAASREIENHCGRRFAADAASNHVFARRLYSGAGYSDPFDGTVLLLDDDLADTAVSITGTPTVTYLPASPPYWGILNEAGWSPPITVNGYWAYSKTPPPDIEFCCLRLTKWIYELRETTRSDAVVVTDQGAVLLPANLPADVIAMLSPYVRVRMARNA